MNPTSQIRRKKSSLYKKAFSKKHSYTKREGQKPAMTLINSHNMMEKQGKFAELKFTGSIQMYKHERNRIPKLKKPLGATNSAINIQQSL